MLKLVVYGNSAIKPMTLLKGHPKLASSFQGTNTKGKNDQLQDHQKKKKRKEIRKFALKKYELFKSGRNFNTIHLHTHECTTQ